ncbi:hypothetical protein MRB53_000358 [Persea americana]|uniref:Uncharacterized protein n=1 Tax=Persea americana TaxID=3435 RepID=A0ACC2MNN4_PERAE|nr:hypothetical protein MRB53_000358 [Persea americana]
MYSSKGDPPTELTREIYSSKGGRIRRCRCGNGGEGSGERREVEDGVVGSESGNGGAGMKVEGEGERRRKRGEKGKDGAQWVQVAEKGKKEKEKGRKERGKGRKERGREGRCAVCAECRKRKGAYLAEKEEAARSAGENDGAESGGQRLEVLRADVWRLEVLRAEVWWWQREMNGTGDGRLGEVEREMVD